MKQKNIESEQPNRAQQLARLEPPAGKVRIVLDTDTYNEVDDQFALAYAVKSPDRISIEAIYAAPFHNSRSEGPRDGMEKSYAEILNILGKMNVRKPVFKGSESFLSDPGKAVNSEAVRDLISRAMTCPDDELLYVVAIGAITNVASAILFEPEIINKIVVVWLGGHAFNAKDTNEFNMKQDIYASQTILDSGVPLVLIPCKGVASHLITTTYELEHYLSEDNELGKYLTDIVKGYANDPFGWSKVIWDIAAIAWLINPEWVPTSIVHSPILTNNITYSFDTARHFIRVADHVDRDSIFADMFKRLNNKKEGSV